MEFFTKAVAALCTILFILSGILALLAFNIEWYAFDPALYKRAFERQNLYARMPDILASALHGYLSANQNSDPYLKELTLEDWKSTIALIVPPEELKVLTDSTLDSTFDYLNNRTDSVVISLLPIKQRLSGPAGMEIVQKILAAQPACTTEQLLQMGMGFLAGDFALCNPPPEMTGLISPLIQSQLQFLTLAIPNEVTLTPSMPGTAKARAGLGQIRTAMKITPVFPLFFLFCVTIFVVRSLMDWLQWWGYPFLITGGTSTLIALLGAPLLGSLVQSLLELYGLSFIPPLLFSAMRETLNAVAAEILRPVFYEGSVLAGIGFVMVLTSLFIIHRNERRR
jgi:hypothetical protein